MTPVIERTELRLLRIAYRRAHGLPDMPDPEFLDELVHELKNQFPANSDQRIESEFFYESEWAKNHDYRRLASHVTTTNDDDVAVKPTSLNSEISPLAGTCDAKST